MNTDTITKDYVRDTSIFADIFNYYIYGGEQVIRPEQLTERDSAKLSLPYGADGAEVPVQRFRDVQKLYAAMTDGRVEYVLLCAENQTEIHYAMPVKNNLYDAVDYAEQVEKAAKSHRHEMRQGKHLRTTGADGDSEKPSAGEFLSGFWKKDKLIPTVTLTLYFGADIWDGPLSLIEMMDISDPAILACMDNYHVRLIAPALMTDQEIMRFQSSLREVMFFIKYSKDKEALEKILVSDANRFRQLERRAVDVIKAVTNSGIKYDRRKERIDVCQAEQDMRKESWDSGKAEGRAEGRAEGKAEGKAEGISIGESQKAQQVAKNLYAMNIGIEQIAACVGYTLDTVQEWLTKAYSIQENAEIPDGQL